ncbi:hypothetical protein BV898_14705 [Hypsibius exemplaris]|uniref:Receptor ligand binding region domain-containing protein n=1 Tax=Hypsibius exemplaris TaxID=2072580 RepID=A0A9X6RJS8_HYPEX|nr:hypothetical protein BV898_14705 [Hypsibius exemplaris]
MFFPWLLLTVTDTTRHIQLITTIPYNFTVDVRTTQAAFAVAADNVSGLYGQHLNLTVTHLYNASHRNCDDVASQSVQMLSDYVYRGQDSTNCYAVVSVACGDQVGIASIARELDWLLFANALSKNNFLDPATGSPTSIALMGTYISFASVILQVLASFSWLHVTIILETKAVSPFYKELALQLMESSRQSSKAFRLESYSLDAATDQTFVSALRFAQKRSRVLLLVTTGKTAARILKLAARDGFTNGEYVFVNIQPSQQVDYGTIDDFRTDLNDTSLIAFRSLIFIAYRPAGEELVELNRAVVQRSQALDNTTYKTRDLPLDLPPVRSSYDSVALFAKLVNESQSSDQDFRCSGLAMAKRLLNQSVHLATGDTFISSERSRNLDLNIFAFNTTIKGLQVVGTFIWGKGNLQWSRSRSISWPTLDGLPPLDVPLCGFSGTEGSCASSGPSSVAITVLSVTISVCFLCGWALVTRWYVIKLKDLTLNWWIMESTDFRREESVPFQR